MTRRSDSWWRDPALRPGLVICLFLALIAATAPLLFPGDPSALGEEGARLAPPSSTHWLGTDLLGRDVLARLVHGSRVSLVIGWLAVAVSVALGTTVGLLAGLGPRRLDRALMLATDLFLAFPRIFLILLLVSVLRPSVGLIVVVLGFSGWMPVARLVRAEALSLRERDFVAAARGLGLTGLQIAGRHVLPNLLPTVVAAATMRVGGVILAESFLSFLGLGVQDPSVSWGVMIQQGRDHLLDGWWLAAFPGLAIALTVVGYNLLGDGLRTRLDPRRGREARHG
ncbi:MAG: ABC transporter permease [Candidatus Krumholzibacteriia bacterium]